MKIKLDKNPPIELKDLELDLVGHLAIVTETGIRVR